MHIPDPNQRQTPLKERLRYFLVVMLTLDMVAKFNIQEISEGDTCKRDYP
jgi:hypothetical protein